MKEEIWTEINESKLYELSNYGNIRNKYNKVLKSFTYIKRGTYKAYSLDGIQYTAHRLVAKYFVNNPNPIKYNIVNHLDKNTHNNYFENLEWTTNKDNLEYSNVAQRVSNKLSKNKIYQYDKDGNIIKIWNSKEECAKPGFAGVKHAIGKNTFNRYFNNCFWFTDKEAFDKSRYKPVREIAIYYVPTKELMFIGSVSDCAKFLNVHPYIINNGIKRNTIVNNYRLVVTNNKL